MKTFIRVVVIGFVSFCLMLKVNAQGSAGLSGFVKDSSGKPIQGAEIRIQGGDANKIGKIHTKGDGHYSYPALEDGTYAVTLLVITSGGIYWQSRFARHGSRYATLSCKGYRPRRMDLGNWRYAAGGFFLLYAALVIGLPFLVLVWSSLQRFYAVPSLAALKTVSLSNYQAVMDYPGIGDAVWNSIVLALATATAVMMLSAIIGWLVLRTRIPGRWVLDNIASLPMVMPGLVIGLAIMVAYLALGGGIYGTN